jgi:NADH-quinone oxidoreductase subunit G
MVVQSSRNELVRYLGVDIDPVNWGWLCDKGRFGFEAVNSEDRLGAPLARVDDQLVPVPWGTAIAQAASALRDADPTRVGVIGGARLTNEDAYAWAKLAKGIIGTDNVDAQLGDGLPAELVLGLPRATIDQVCAPGGTVLLLAADVKEELPVLFLRLRHAVVNDGVRLVELSPRLTSVSELAAATLLHRPGAEGELVAALLGGATDREVAGIEPAALAAAQSLLEGGPVTVVIGRTSVADSGAGIAAAATAIHAAHPEVRFLSALRRGNVHGALDMGLAPGLLPGRVGLSEAGEWFRDGGWPTVPAERGMDTTGILQAAAAGKLDVLVLLGSDPLSDFPDTGLATRAVAGARTVIAVEQFLTAAAQQADVVLAAAGFAEVDGTTTNIEGRLSTVARKVTPPGTARSDWMIASELARLLGADLGVESVVAISDEIAALAPSHAGITWELLHSAEGRDGVVAPLAPTTPPSGAGPERELSEAAEQVQAPAADEADAPTADVADTDPVEPAPPDSARPAVLVYTGVADTTAPPVDAYSLRLVATRKLYDLGTTTQRSPSLAALVPGTAVHLNPYDFDRVGVEEGAAVSLTSSAGSITLPAYADLGIPRGSAAVVFNQGPGVGALIDATTTVTEVRVAPA